MSKLTKRQRERIDAEKSALRDRLFDMLVGAAGGASLQEADDEADYLVMGSIGLGELSSWMKSIRNYCGFTRTADWPQAWTDDELKERAFHFDNLRQFDTLNTTTKHLYEFGFRA